MLSRLNRTAAAAALFFLTSITSATAAEGLVNFKLLSLETAMELAQGALSSCRDKGFQVAVAVVDRFGNMQVMMRDRFAGPHTPDTARRKAWTAISFRSDTIELSKLTKTGQPQSGARDVTGALMLGGGVPVEAGGSIVAGVGVSGAPGGEEDDACARVGIEKVLEKLEF